MDEKLSLIEQKIYNGERLTRDDGLFLLKSDELLRIGALARFAKQRKSGNKVYFNVNRHINLTNICVSRCKLCAFGCDTDASQAYVMEPEKALSIARQALADAPEMTELHIVSALHPDKPFTYYADIIARIHQEFPNLHLKAFTAVEIAHFAKIANRSIREVLTILKDAGLGSLPGGGAEILNDRVRQIICPNKCSAAEWLEVAQIAHELGIHSNATMLYGHVETQEERIDHLLTLRKLQDKTGRFQAFIPFPFHPENTGLSDIKRATAWEDLKMLAISRLILDNFDHVKAFWIMLTLPIAQVSMAFGIDDLDGTVVEEKILHAAGAKTAVGISKQAIIDFIRETGNIPVERDTLYREVQVYEGSQA
ncbi:Aminodeoxyfutalosine synthase [Sporomusa ovata DSM 2662]|uniref:Aminodeoxyfutalosine synthase n=1 Tax=Sporomusa ovata TaxID=2378 RepID=A0A0U1KX68_9FIRM|nr:aminofutalosine synthase MqnE [Sporomusa ovata]EQB28321.1 FO synthase subunit 2 [Sporomusa ovata DSM 2662]CQR71865.1 Gene SCO4494, often clustered with other genes in menaquinone via futalosine pathway [Sporomusa ovata]